MYQATGPPTKQVMGTLKRAMKNVISFILDLDFFFAVLKISVTVVCRVSFEFTMKWLF